MPTGRGLANEPLEFEAAMEEVPLGDPTVIELPLSDLGLEGDTLR